MQQDLRRRAEELIRKGRAEDAVPLLSRVLAEFPDDPGTYCTLAQAYFSLGAYEASLNFTERAIRVAPDLEAPYRHKAMALNVMGRHEEAHEALGDALKIAPDDPKPWEIFVDVLLALGRVDEAVTAAATLVALDAESAGAHRAQTEVARALRDWPAVEQHARKYLDSAPNHAEARRWLSEALVELDRMPEAIELHHRLTCAHPTERELRRRLEWLLDHYLHPPGPPGRSWWHPSRLWRTVRHVLWERRQRIHRLSPEVRSYLHHEIHYESWMPRLKFLAISTIELSLIWTGLSLSNPTFRPSHLAGWGLFAALWLVALWSSAQVAVWMFQHYEMPVED